MPTWSFALISAPTAAPVAAPAAAPAPAPAPAESHGAPTAAPSPAPSTVVNSAAPTARWLDRSAWPCTWLAANTLQPDWSVWNASKLLPGPGITWTVGPSGVWAHPASKVDAAVNAMNPRAAMRRPAIGLAPT